jgi:hypothetical protein
MSIMQEIEYELKVLLAEIDALFHKAKVAAVKDASVTGATGVSGATGPKA